MSFRSILLQQASLYRYRYVFGYGFVIAVLLFLVTTDIGNLPSGLSAAEMNQAVTSMSLHFSWDFGWLINLPYNFVQKVSVEAFGLSRLTLSIPSLLFGGMTVIIFTLTMNQWFRNTVAVVATTITLTSIAFISMVRNTTPEIMLPFWLSLIIFGAVRLLIRRDHAFVWKLLIIGASLGLLYTPYGIYALLAIFISAFFHPHVRSRFRHIRRHRLVIIALLIAVGIAPFIAYIVVNRPAFETLLGLPLLQESFGHIGENAAIAFDLYGNVFKNGFNGTIIVPLFGVATLALALLGLFQSVVYRFTARSYVLFAWTGTAIFLALLAPGQAAFMFLPISFLMAIGIDTLVVRWYKLFPRNPYARITGLIPLTILFLGITASNISHYFNDYSHISNSFYSQSLSAIQSSLVVEGEHPVILIAKPQDVAFYSLLQKEHTQLTVTTTLPSDAATPTFVIPDSGQTFSFAPSRIITSANKDASVALRVYRPQ